MKLSQYQQQTSSKRKKQRHLHIAIQIIMTIWLEAGLQPKCWHSFSAICANDTISQHFINNILTSLSNKIRVFSSIVHKVIIEKSRVEQFHFKNKIVGTSILKLAMVKRFKVPIVLKNKNVNLKMTFWYLKFSKKRSQKFDKFLP